MNKRYRNQLDEHPRLHVVCRLKKGPLGENYPKLLFSTRHHNFLIIIQFEKLPKVCKLVM